MTKLNLNTQKTLTASAMIVGLASVAGSAAAAPTAMDATATVQNAVTITQTTPLNFGTVFATNAVASGSATNTASGAAASNKLVLAPTGGVTAANGASTIRILAIGGTPTAGVYAIPSLPRDSNVAVLLTTSTNVPVVNETTTALANCRFDNPTAALAAGKIALSLTGSNPNSTAFFCLDALTASVGGTAVPAGQLLQTTTAATGYTLGFNLTALTFNLGATLVQQVPTDNPRSYEVGAYTGAFGMEVTFL